MLEHSRGPRHHLSGSEAFLVQASFLACAPEEPQSIPIYGGHTIELSCMMIVLPALIIRLRDFTVSLSVGGLHPSRSRTSEIALRYADDSQIFFWVFEYRRLRINRAEV